MTKVKRKAKSKLKKTLSKIIVNYWPILVITAVIFAFFSRLFFPEPSIFITPDYGRSDSY